MHEPEIIPQAAVALVEWLDHGESRILVLQRAEHPKDPWSGHLAFPGGRKELGDLDLFHTCIREVSEECGFSLKPSELVKSLPIASAGSRARNPIWVQPWYFCVQEQPEIKLDPKEMQRYFWVKKHTLLLRENHQNFEPIPGRRMPCIYIDGLPIWGFTYGVLEDWLQSS